MKTLFFIFFFLCASSSKATDITFVTEEMPPFQFTNKQQQLSGAMVELVNAMIKQTRFSATITSYPWARTYQIALTRPNTIIFSLLRDEKREASFHWIGKLYQLTSHLAALKSRKDIVLNELSDIKNYTVGTIREDFAEAYLKKKGFISKKNYYASSKYNILWGQLFNNRIDLAFTNSVLWQYELIDSGYDPDDLVLLYQIEDIASDLYIAANLNTDKKVIEQLSTALDKLKKNGQYQAILTKWHL